MSKSVEYKPLGLFDYIKGMTSQKAGLNFDDPLVSKGYSKFIINKTLSSSEMFVPALNETFNRLGASNIPDALHYRYLMSVLPPRYIKLTVPKASAKGDRDWMKPYLADFFEVGTKDIDLIMSRISEEDLELIMADYKLGMDGKFVEL